TRNYAAGSARAGGHASHANSGGATSWNWCARRSARHDAPCRLASHLHRLAESLLELPEALLGDPALPHVERLQLHGLRRGREHLRAGVAKRVVRQVERGELREQWRGHERLQLVRIDAVLAEAEVA